MEWCLQCCVVGTGPTQVEYLCLVVLSCALLSTNILLRDLAMQTETFKILLVAKIIVSFIKEKYQKKNSI